MNNYDSSDVIKKIYGANTHIDRKIPGHYPDTTSSSFQFKKKRFSLLPIAAHFIRQKCDISMVIKELVFSGICMAVLHEFLNGAKLANVKGFGAMVCIFLIAAIAYQFFKASCKSFIPGFICLGSALIIKYFGVDNGFFNTLSMQHVNYIFGVGGIFIAMTVLCDKNNNEI